MILPKTRRMDELRDKLAAAHPSNWEIWPVLRGLRHWFVALGAIILIAVPWGIRAEERSLEKSSRAALTEAGLAIEDITFSGRQATIVADLSTNDQIAAVAVLHDMGGVSRVTWQEGSGRSLPPSAATPPTTAVPEPSAHLAAVVKNGAITLRGAVPDAGTIKEVTDSAARLWGSNVVNQQFVDSSLVALPWLAGAAESVAVLPLLIDPQLTLDADGATLTGEAISQPVLDLAATWLSQILGPDVAIDNKVTLTRLDLPNLEIISPGNGTVVLEGTVPNADIRRALVIAAAQGDEDVEIGNRMRWSETTADVYLLARLPQLIDALGGAAEWTLRFDGESLGGTASGGRAFHANRVRPTAALAGLVELLAELMQADPHLRIEVGVHVTLREDSNVDGTALARERADAIADHLVRLGIHPGRITASPAAGDGELLRFQLIPADQ